MKNIVGFHSCFKNELNNYLELRENMGGNCKKIHYIFLSLDKCLLGCTSIDNQITSSVIDSWITSLAAKLNANTVNFYISHYVQFARYLQSIGYLAFIPEKIIGNKNYVPYIFNEMELSALIHAADSMTECATEKQQEKMLCFSIMLRLLIGCGFRINEVRMLKTKDIDLNHGVICIRKAKGNRERLVPMDESLTDILKIYSQTTIPLKESWFFPSKLEEPIALSFIRNAFLKCLSDIGIQRPILPKHSRNICLHCLRHSYAVSALHQLDSNDLDLYNEIPILSTYMGHENLYGTEHYLHMTTQNSEAILSRMEIYHYGIFPEVIE